MLWILLVLVLMVIFGTYVRRKAAQLRAEEGTEIFRGSVSEAKRRPHVVVRIPISGTMANPEEMHVRLAIEDEIERRKIGSVADAGSAKGEMHLLVVAAGGDAPRAAEGIRDVLASVGLADKAHLDILGNADDIT